MTVTNNFIKLCLLCLCFSVLVFSPLLLLFVVGFNVAILEVENNIICGVY